MLVLFEARYDDRLPENHLRRRDRNELIRKLPTRSGSGCGAGDKYSTIAAATAAARHTMTYVSMR